jgi:hypothetical protein
VRQSKSEFHRYSINNKIAVDFIGKYENLEQDLKTVCKKTGIPSNKPLPVTKAHTRKETDDYHKFYNQELKNIIAKKFAKEIRLLGYQY